MRCMLVKILLQLLDVYGLAEVLSHSYSTELRQTAETLQV